MDYYTLLYTIVDKQVRTYVYAVHCVIVVLYVCTCVLQIATAVQSHTTDYEEGDIPSYQLYLQLGDILKMAVNVSQEYVLYNKQ